MWMLIFMLLPLLGVTYVAWHVWILLPLASLWRWLAVAVIVGSFLLLFFVLGRRLDGYPLPVAQVLYETGTGSIIVLLYLVMLFLLLDVGRLLHLVPRQLLYANWATAAAIVVLVTGLFVYANAHYNNKVRVELDLTSTKRLPRDYKVVMASDLHLGYHNPRRELARWVDLMNQEQPDFILIAGDIIDMSIRPLIEEDMAAEFRRLQAPVYACLGNHEYYSGEPQAQQFYREAGICLLSDDYALAGSDSAIAIVGRDDRTNRSRKSVADLMEAVRSSASLSSTALNLSSSPYVILLDHQPYQLELAEQAGVDFQLSGHTHRGQVWPISWITDALYECSWGSHQRGATRYYVSSGLGIWGGKFRIGTQSEYVVATIRTQQEKRS